MAVTLFLPTVLAKLADGREIASNGETVGAVVWSKWRVSWLELSSDATQQRRTGKGPELLPRPLLHLA